MRSLIPQLFCPLQRLKLDRQEAAATSIQRIWRRGLAYHLLRELKEQFAKRQAFLAIKSLVIQRYTRGYLARLRLKEAKREQERLKDVAAKLEIWAATLVQVKEKDRDGTKYKPMTCHVESDC